MGPQPQWILTFPVCTKFGKQHIHAVTASMFYRRAVDSRQDNDCCRRSKTVRAIDMRDLVAGGASSSRCPVPLSLPVLPPLLIAQRPFPAVLLLHLPPMPKPRQFRTIISRVGCPRRVGSACDCFCMICAQFIHVRILSLSYSAFLFRCNFCPRR